MASTTSKMKLRILLVGGGGREHALAWKLAQCDRVEAIHVVPGNGGTVGVPKCNNIPALSPDDFAALVRHAAENMLNFLIPGPEAPLVAGITDYFARHAPDILVFGPSKAAARMEGSKTFSKDFMRRHRIPTARYENFSDRDAAEAYLDSVDYPVVIKADGLAAGKGVVLPASKAEARSALQSIMGDKEFGSAGDAIVVEERLEGDEISILSLTDGVTIRSLPPAQDHKRIGDDDTGPNTGGMGTYAPTPSVSQAQLEEIEKTVLRPTIDGMKAEGMTFVGCLFTGLMLTESGPKVLEYNVRFGDPETQSCLSLLDSDLAELLHACSTGLLADQQLRVSGMSACTVVVAAAGYPGSYAKNTPMRVQPTPEGGNTYIFHAGTTLDGEGMLRTSGGRVIAATATGQTLREAVDKAYGGVALIEFEGLQYRKDIAKRALR
ncbi:Bifunctional purine biosynthetic protein ADE1 [Friedmanniomyces endolithicus]|uniref:phosphoribosylamine--glycine ligase n=1 Tax=Friedmanniomyces endolithicus TaxID=329885 RepID=A0AAN6H9F6_9PEZI|nr:Bifunctional purine biosynthetic protein ADE1 [Friedmanniomyces endolithicus]KAK0772914.1 Bifunctional purine biosynthetic protein ADE1 [Friedmanniomyces endolithicus]KAK0776379.1 Bifunctional purine biosynthetic protein ADE1 [Friedmanniomyces endolithicus]KAK0776886.1 Bifunctional purine biosynthetic protein ADE1 [Friedmanniomyces endolithicus]KAK0831886.1 Bifunctional purine biosynthetic protein ADE1 [Friedmanniomyces endolithicus]